MSIIFKIDAVRDPRNTKLHRRRDVTVREDRSRKQRYPIDRDYANVSGPVTGLELRSAAPRTRNPSLPVPTTFFFSLSVSLERPGLIKYR